MKKAEKQAWFHTGIGLLVGLLLGGVVTTVIAHTEHRSLMRNMDTKSAYLRGKEHHGLSMDEMHLQLQGKTGDAFDRAFLDMMIPHHQGAVDMAELAQKHAKHQEIKTLANNIVISQLKEISDMYQWQKAWGYFNNNQMMHGH